MLFNSYIFIFGFLPIVWLVFFRIGKYSHNLALLWLAVASIFFYGWWNAQYVSLLMTSIIFNYGSGRMLKRYAGNYGYAKAILFLAISLNLLLLGYYKYTNFFIENLNQLSESSIHINTIILPLGISFFTFTQIAFLVDTFQHKVNEFNFVRYLLFVTYFPHLIAGPVLHHKEMMPQFSNPDVVKVNWDRIFIGAAVFMLGLAKKVLIADVLSNYSTPVFDAALAGKVPMFLDAWLGVLSYTFQLYFDFSAYSDMAIGLSLLFNVRLPVNFNSPYKSTSIIDFWRRWHITLSRFLRDYLYIPLGGNQNGRFNRYFNLIVTMLLGGLWHGAGWTFVIWGGLHGFYLIINHTWRHLKSKLNWGDGGWLTQVFSGALTFLSVSIGWVFFRAENYTVAISVIKGMVGLNGYSYQSTVISSVTMIQGFWVIFFSSLIIWLLPNLQEVFNKDVYSLSDLVKSKTGKFWLEIRFYAIFLLSFLFGVVAAFSVILISADSPFLYFQF